MSSVSSHKELDRLLRLAPRAGEYRIDVYVLAHRPVDINKRTYFFSDEIFVFRTTEQADLDTLRERYPSHPEIAGAVENFPDGKHYVAHYNKNSRLLKIWDNPDEWKPSFAGA